MLGGILLGRSLEERLSLRPRRDGATLLTDSLATLFQFHAAGRLSAGLLGEGFRSWERGVEARTELLGDLQLRPRWGGTLGRPLAPALAAEAAVVSDPAKEASRPEGNAVFMMGGKGGEKGGSAKIDETGLLVVREVQNLNVPETGDMWSYIRRWIEAQPHPIIVGEMVWGLDLSRVKMFNEAFRRRLGYEESQLSGKTVRKIFQSLTDAFVGARVSMLRAGEFSPTRMRLKSGSGEPVWCVGAGMIREIQGKKIAFGIFTDFPPETASPGDTPKPPSGVRSVVPPASEPVLDSNKVALDHFRRAQQALGVDPDNPDKKKPR
jgi:PAS domain S-box-containing protein